MFWYYYICGECCEDCVGVWVCCLDWGVEVEDKIVVIGICLWKWVMFYGISFNVELEFDYFFGIVFCGISEYGVISLVDFGLLVIMVENDSVLRVEFEKIFGLIQLV